MSQLSKSLEKRIQELTTSIESQKAELAAYEQVLRLETGKEESVKQEAPVHEPAATKEEKEETPAAAVAVTVSPELQSNKTALVLEIIRQRGTSGASPKEIDAYFAAHHISHSKNAIYNILSYLTGQKRLKRTDGRYFFAESKQASVSHTANSPAPAKVAATTKKQRLSPEGLRKIKEALKKRWAAKRAAEAAASKAPKKK